VQDGGLLFVGEAEQRHRPRGGTRVVERVITAEDHAVDSDLPQHPGELVRERAAGQHRAGDRDVDPHVPPPPRVAGEHVVKKQLSEARAVRVGQDEPGLRHLRRKVHELARLVRVPRRVGVEQHGQPVPGGPAHHPRDGGLRDVEVLGVRVQLEPCRPGGGNPVDLLDGGRAVRRVDRADRVEKAPRVHGELEDRVVAGHRPFQVAAVRDGERGGTADPGTADQGTVCLRWVRLADDLACWVKHRMRVRVDDGAAVHGVHGAKP